jgi:hypothetical protein
MVVSRRVRRAAALTLVVPLLGLAPLVPSPTQPMAQPAVVWASAKAGRTATEDHPALAGARLAVAAAFGEELSRRWNAFYRSWLKPARNVVLPWLAVLVVLLAVARLATPVLVATDAVTHEGRRIATWWGGLLLLCAAAAVPVGASYARGEPKDGWWKADVGAFWLIVVIAAPCLALCLAWAFNFARRTPGEDPSCERPPAHERPGLLVVITPVASVIAALLLVVVGGLGWAITSFERATAALWVLGLFLAVVGVVWLAVGRGETLKLQVDVRKNDGTADPNAAHYLVARLQDLGSARPRGLEAPQQTDVTTLPDTALKTLPGGGVAVAVSNALQLVRSAVPWHGTVSLVDDDTAVVTLARNGRVAEDTRRVSRLELKLVLQRSADLNETSKNDKGDKGKDEEGDDGTRARAELATAAAAFLLCALAERHPQLRRGLCGAKKWESIAQQPSPPRRPRPPTTRGMNGCWTPRSTPTRAICWRRWRCCRPGTARPTSWRTSTSWPED